MIPGEVADAAFDGDKDTVAAWLDEHPQSVNDEFHGATLLLRCIQGRLDGVATNQEDQLELLRYLLSQGADPNCGADGMTPLYFAAGQHSPHALRLLTSLLHAGANPNLKVDEATPLAAVIDALLAVPDSSWSLPVVASLLRYGASLDNCESTLSAEDLIAREERGWPWLATQSQGARCFQAAKTLIHGVRAAGSWKKYCRARCPHREILALRSLAMRGYIAPYQRRRTRGAEYKIAIAFVARLGDNGVVWNILSFWRDPDDIEDIVMDDGDVVRVCY